MKKTNMLLVASTFCLFTSGIVTSNRSIVKEVIPTKRRQESRKEIYPKQIFSAEKQIQENKNITTISMKPGFYSINQSIYFFDELGIPHTGFINFEGDTYYLFDKEGLAYGWNDIDNFTYYFNEDGKMVHGLQTIENKEYFFDDEGKLETGFQKINDKIFYFDNSGKKTGFLYLDNNIYYIDEKHGLLTSFQTISDHEYYFDDTGIMKLGFQTINDKTYYFNENGWRTTGWINDNDDQYYLDETALLTNFQVIDEETYYFNNQGQLQFGIQEINEGLYYFGVDGKMRHGFQTIEGKLYYFDHNGKSITGFIEDNNNTYFLDENHILKIGLQTINDSIYYFDEQGVMQTGFHDIDKQTKYFDETGKMATGKVLIQDQQYIFDSLGNLQKQEEVDKTFYKFDGTVLATNAKKVIDVSKFQGNIDWEQVKASDIDGVILRLGFGSYSLDSKFLDNLNELKRLEIPYGIYLYSYAVNEIEAEAEANFVISSLENYQLNPTLGIYYDIESNDITSHLSIFDYEQIIPTFLNLVRTSKFKTSVYTYKSLAESKLYSESLTKEITWIAQYNSICTWKGFYEGWQYTSSGKVQGIQGNVDISIFGNFKR